MTRTPASAGADAALQEADILALPLLDGGWSVAQVARCLGPDLRLLLTRRHYTDMPPLIPLTPAEVIAVRDIDARAVPGGSWPVLGFEAIPRLADLPRWPPQPEDPRDDPALIEAFVNAAHGLYPWDGFGAAFFDAMLRPGIPRPPAARLTVDMPDTD